MIHTYKGFSAKIQKDGEKWTGIIFGLEIIFEADTEENCVNEFHRIADEHQPEPD